MCHHMYLPDETTNKAYKQAVHNMKHMHFESALLCPNASTRRCEANPLNHLSKLNLAQVLILLCIASIIKSFNQLAIDFIFCFFSLSLLYTGCCLSNRIFFGFELILHIVFISIVYKISDFNCSRQGNNNV